MLKEHQIQDPAAREILEGASQLFMRYGVKSITMDEIARHLSISKKTIYQHFTDKEELVETFAHVAMYRQQTDLLQLEQKFPNILEGILHMSEFVRTEVCSINPGLLFDLKKYFPKAWKVFLDHKRYFLKDHIIRVIRKGIEQGFFRSDINLEIIARMRIEQVELSFNPDVFPPAEFNIRDVHIQLFQHFLLGICTPLGYEEFNKIIKTL